MEITRSTISFGSFTIRWYGVLIALGVLGAVVLASYREKRLGLKKDTAVNVALLGVPLGIICARLYYVVFSWSYYASDPAQIFNIREGGLAIYGGVIGGLLAGLLYAKAAKVKFLSLADLAAPSIALGQAVGRWGNFLNQEAYGIPAKHLQFFPVSVFIEGSGWHLATFFYESLWCALIVLFILFKEKKGFFRRRGDVFFTYVLMYALERSFVEGLRTDSLYLGTIRVSQLLSLAAALAVIVMFILRAGKTHLLLRVLPLAALFAEAAAILSGSALLPLPFALLTIAAVYVLVKRNNDL